LNASTTTTVTWALPPTKGHGLIIWLAVGMTGSPEKTGTLVIRHVTAVFEAWPD
jgi:RNA polymerase sigma factor (sigma-70 family)